MSDIKIETNIFGAEMLTGFTEHRTGGYGGQGKAGPITIEEAKQLIGWLPLESVKVESTYLTEEGFITINEGDQKHLLHPVTHKVLGRHTEGYKVHGYEDTLLRDAAAITSGELGIAKVTLLGGGKRAAVQYELDENVTTKDGVQLRPYLSAVTSLDGSTATSFFTGSTIIICDNSLQLAIKRAIKSGLIYRRKHTRNSEVDVPAAREAIGLVFQTADAFTQEIDKLTAEYVSDQKWKDFLDALVPEPKADAPARTRGNAERKRASLTRLWNSDPRVAPWKNSAYGAVAAVNTWANHEQVVKGTSREVRNVANTIDGKFAALDQLALRTLAAV